MACKVTIFKRVEVSPGVIKKVPLRNITVHDTFIGIGRRGVKNNPEFLRLAEDLEAGETNLGVDLLEV